MAPQSPTPSLYRHRYAMDVHDVERSRRIPVALTETNFMGRPAPYQRYIGVYHGAYDEPTKASSLRRPHFHDAHQHHHTHHHERKSWETARFQRRASDDTEFEASPVATPQRLPTIDALCGASTRKRLRGGAPATLDKSAASRVAESSSLNQTTLPSNSHPTKPSETRYPEMRTPTRPPSRTSSAEDGDDESVEAIEATATVPPTKKRQRYLRDVDRRSIILRIEKGEKQAALAREFGVTRAAICHIKKNRDEIVSRYESLLESAKEMERAGMTTTASPETTTTPRGACSVLELTRPSVLLLLTTLRDVATTPRAFRAAADRLMMVLLEEALVSVATVACDLRTTSGQTVRGVRPGRRVCCVAVGHKGLPLVRLCHELEPSGGVGCVQILKESRGGDVVPVVGRAELPRGIATPDASVLLFTCSTAMGQSVCAAIDALLNTGVMEEHVHVVALACSTTAVDAITRQFPGVHILTCAVEASAAKESATPSTTLSDFLERYSAIKAEPRLSTSVDDRHARPHVERRVARRVEEDDEDDVGECGGPYLPVAPHRFHQARRLH